MDLYTYCPFSGLRLLVYDTGHILSSSYAGRNDSSARGLHRQDKTDTKTYFILFQAFILSLASRVGTGNLAGVATAITMGGPGAVFLDVDHRFAGIKQCFRRIHTGPTLSNERAVTLHRRSCLLYGNRPGRSGMGILFAVLITITSGFAFNSVQSNTILCGIRQCFPDPSSYNMGSAITLLLHPDHHLRRYTPHRQDQQHPGAAHGIRIHSAGSLHCPEQYHPIAGCSRTDHRKRFRIRSRRSAVESERL